MRLLTFTLMLGLGFIVGCSQNSSPPPPLAAAELPAAFGKAFGAAKPEAKALANQVHPMVYGIHLRDLYFAIVACLHRPKG